MNANNLPDDLSKIIDSEPIDFAVKARRHYSRGKAIFNIVASLIIFAFLVNFVSGFFSSALLKVVGAFTMNEIKTVLINNGLFFIVPGLFLLGGMLMVILSIVRLLQKGGYFVGTKSRFINYRNGKIRVTDWKQFTGSISAFGSDNSGNLILGLKTGKMRKSKQSSHSSPTFIPDFISIYGIPNVKEIEEKCRTRILENNPTLNNKQVVY